MADLEFIQSLVATHEVPHVSSESEDHDSGNDSDDSVSDMVCTCPWTALCTLHTAHSAPATHTGA